MKVEEIKEAIDFQPPCNSAINHLQQILEGQFGLETDKGRRSPDNVADANPVDTGADLLNLENRGNQSWKMKIAAIIDDKYFLLLFLLLTVYAIFVTDLDLLLGDKTSAYNLSIATTVVWILFLIEIVLQCIARTNYFGRAYFWLDIVALLSLLPNTWVAQVLIKSNNAFVAGRSTKFTRMLRIATRSSRSTRLQRLMRIVRVASLMPRIGKAFGQRVKFDDAEKVLEKKLRRIFLFLDEDMDGMIPKVSVASVLNKFKVNPDHSKSTLQELKEYVVDTLSAMAQARRERRNSSEVIRADSVAQLPAVSSPSSPPPEENAASPEPQVGESRQQAQRAEASRVLSRAVLPPAVSFESTNKKKGLVRFQGVVTAQAGHHSHTVRRQQSEDDRDLDETMVSFQEFRTIVLQDDVVATRLRTFCEQQIRQGNNMKNLTARHSEYVAVKVALGVIALLFILTLMEPVVKDTSLDRGLGFLSTVMSDEFGGLGPTAVIPDLIREQVDLWRSGVVEQPRQILYLDVQKHIYCNRFVNGGQGCDQPTNFSGIRPSLETLDKEVAASDYRLDDLVLVRVPDFSDYDISSDDLNRLTVSVAVLYDRDSAQSDAWMSITTTFLVIIIILSGVVLLTKDLTFLSRNLLKPLRELADDVESVAQLQLAGVTSWPEDKDAEVSDGPSEVRLIRRTFENMKKAIKSWGKYVPWPVVQLLLRAGIEANLEVSEMEVTMFFSDIAGFTTIVESIAPEFSLLLLSRYFSDMSKVIDNHGGVVLEFIGDAIQCIFGAPLANEDHPAAAVEASLKMLLALRRINEWCKTNSDHPLPEISIRCGVHTGKVLVGNLGFHSRMKYGIVGEDASIPGKLEELNKTFETSLLISESTFRRLPPGHFFTRPVDYVQLRQDSAAPAELVYEVMILKKRRASLSVRDAAALHEEALRHYRRQEFTKALEKFTQVNAVLTDIQCKEDVASAVMIRRCQSFLEKAPPADWDGSWTRAGEAH